MTQNLLYTFFMIASVIFSLQPSLQWGPLHYEQAPHLLCYSLCTVYHYFALSLLCFSYTKRSLFPLFTSQIRIRGLNTFITITGQKQRAECHLTWWWQHKVGHSMLGQQCLLPLSLYRTNLVMCGNCPCYLSYPSPPPAPLYCPLVYWTVVLTKGFTRLIAADPFTHFFS